MRTQLRTCTNLVYVILDLEKCITRLNTCFSLITDSNTVGITGIYAYGDYRKIIIEVGSHAL